MPLIVEAHDHARVDLAERAKLLAHRPALGHQLGDLLVGRRDEGPRHPIDRGLECSHPGPIFGL